MGTVTRLRAGCDRADRCRTCDGTIEAVATLVERETAFDLATGRTAIGRTKRAAALACPDPVPVQRLSLASAVFGLTIVAVTFGLGRLLVPALFGVAEIRYADPPIGVIGLACLGLHLFFAESRYAERKAITAAAADRIRDAYQRLRYCPTCNTITVGGSQVWPASAEGVRTALHAIADHADWPLMDGVAAAIEDRRLARRRPRPVRRRAF